jgi:hypothetical protein
MSKPRCGASSQGQASPKQEIAGRRSRKMVMNIGEPGFWAYYVRQVLFFEVSTWRELSLSFKPSFTWVQTSTEQNISRHGSVSKPCTLGEHQNSW